MRCSRILGLASLVALAAGCGNDDRPAPMDAGGSGDVDAGADAGGIAPMDAAGGCPDASPRDVGAAGRIAVAGDPGGAPFGFGDPSIIYPSGAAAGFMSYTAVGLSAAETRVATSTDHGATWSFVGAVNSTTPITVTTTDMAVCGAASCPGRWVHEVSTIIEDPTDPDPARRFKIFAHSYFITAADSHRYDIGSIDLWTAPMPAATAGWTETRLLGWTSASAQSSTGVQTVVTRDAALSPLLSRCIALTEPGALVRGGTIDLALGCIRFVSPGNFPIEVVLIRSIDHGATWAPVATLLDVTDAAALGAAGSAGPQINAADLFEVGGDTYLFATPNGPVTTLGATTSSGYRGCVAIRFEDIETGQLETCGGALVVSGAFQGPAGLFQGACTYAEGASATGVAGIVADSGASPVFQMFRTGVAGP